MRPLKTTIKRGALLAAANWQVTLIQAVADSLYKMLIAVPVIGGALIGALIIGAEPEGLLSLGGRDLLTTLVTALLSQPFALIAFLSALGIVVVGGSFLMFLVKGGTVATLVAGEHSAGPIEDPPLRLSTLAPAVGFSADSFIAACERLFPRYVRLGLMLMSIYLVSGAVYLAGLVTNRPADSWGGAALITTAFVAWITVVNLLYLLTQIVIAADDCSVATAMRRVAALLRADFRNVSAVFGVVLTIVVLATGVSILATAALGLIAFVPLFGLTVLPLQLLAWALRGVVFQYIGLTSVGAYLSLYRVVRVPAASPAAAAAEPASDPASSSFPAAARSRGRRV